MSGRRVFAPVAVVLAAALLLTCGRDPMRPPVPGWMDLTLVTPNDDDGGIVFTVGGAPIDSVRSDLADTYLRRDGDSTVRVVIVGSIGAGVLAQVLVPDTRRAGDYVATVLEVAARASFVQRPLAGYVLTAEPAP